MHGGAWPSGGQRDTCQRPRAPVGRATAGGLPGVCGVAGHRVRPPRAACERCPRVRDGASELCACAHTFDVVAGADLKVNRELLQLLTRSYREPPRALPGASQSGAGRGDAGPSGEVGGSRGGDGQRALRRPGQPLASLGFSCSSLWKRRGEGRDPRTAAFVLCDADVGTAAHAGPPGEPAAKPGPGSSSLRPGLG